MQGTDRCPQTRRFGVFELDPRAAELRKRGVRIKLQDQPFQILSLLLDSPGEIVTREELRQKLWPAHTFVDFDRSLNKAMAKLRSALGDSAESPRYVETVPRHGYRFLPPVVTQNGENHSNRNQKLPDNGSTGEPRSSTEKNGQNGHELTRAGTLTDPSGAAPSGLHSSSARRRFYAIATFAVIIVITALAYIWRRDAVFGGPRVNARLSVAVLEFKNLSGDSQEAWLSTAFSDWLMTELTAGEQIRIIPAESVARMKVELSLPDVDSLSRESLARIRKNLGTDFVVVGSYATLGSRSDGQIRLDLRLQDTRSGETTGAISEAGTEARLLDLVSRAGADLRGKLGMPAVTTAQAAEVAIALPNKAETAKPYSEGLAKLRVFDALAARDLLRKAVGAQPNYALSHAALASAWAQLGYEANAKTEAKTAFDLSGNLSRAERLLVEGRYREMSREWERAIEIYRALFDFFPDNLEYGLALANVQYSANKWKDALDTIAALRKLPDPIRQDPRIDLSEADPARSLGDMKRAEAALAHAAGEAQAAGASLLLARARREQGWLYENLGRQSEADAAIAEAKQLYLAAHDRLGVAAATTLEAIALEHAGDYLGAKRKYEESLAIYRDTGNRLSLSNEYDNVGDVLFYLGDLIGARKSYENALANYQEIGDQNGAALAELGLGDVYLALGRHAEAKASYQEALEICQRLGNRGRGASALAGLARLQRLEGDVDGARANEAEAIARFEAVGDRSELEHVRVQSAALLLDDGKNSEAAELAQRAGTVFESTKAGRYAAEANLILAEALLAEGRVAEASGRVEQVVSFTKASHTEEMELLVAIAAARVEVASGNAADVNEAKRRLNRVIGDASAGSFTDVAREARLALGEIELSSGNLAAGRRRLETLQKDSANAGALLIARKAAAALHAASNRAAN
jgi:eukaryotic-like serine/threonine-protein kinase